MGIYEDAQASAAEALGEFAQGETKLVRVYRSGPEYSPSDSVQGEETVNAVVSGVSRQYVDGTTIVQSDLQATIPGSVDPPQVDDLFAVDGQRLAVLRVLSKPAAGTPVVHVVILRG